MLELDQSVSTWFEQWRGASREAITIRHIMGHCSGLAAGTWSQLNANPPSSFVSYVVNELPLVAAPGTTQVYNNAAVSVLPAIIAHASGQPFLEFAESELFNPLGIKRWDWRSDAAGTPYAMAAASFSAASLAAVGKLLASNGCHDGRQIVPPEWARTCRQPPIAGARLGLLMMQRWPCSDPRRLGSPIAFGHDGSEGQYLFVYPSSRLVVARLRECGASTGQFIPSTPDQVFPQLPRLAESIDEVLAQES